jgi:HEAT repeat protein
MRLRGQTLKEKSAWGAEKRHIGTRDPAAGQGVTAVNTERRKEERIVAEVPPLELELEAEVTRWIEKLKGDNPRFRLRAAGALGVIGAKARSAVPALIEALRDHEPLIRKIAVSSLGEIGPEARTAIPALIGMLRDPDQNVRLRAIMTLGTFGAEARSAVPFLVQALREDTLTIRRWAAATLGEIGPTAPASIPALLESLRNPDVRLQTVARTALKRMGSRAVPKLIGCLGHKDAQLRRQAALLLGKLGCPPEAGAALAGLLADLDSGVREAAQQALEQVGK